MNRRAEELLRSKPRRVVSPAKIIIGLTGPFQHGKIELRPVIEALGWEFMDVNEIQNAMHLPGSKRFKLYQRLIPGSLDDEGWETSRYYGGITPALYARLYEPEIAPATRILKARLAESKSQKIVVSWEQLRQVADQLPLAHVIVMRQTKKAWYGKLRARAAELNFASLPSDTFLDRLVQTMQVEPGVILDEIRRKMPRRHSVLDVSAADWNAQGLIHLLRNLGTPGRRRRK